MRLVAVRWTWALVFRDMLWKAGEVLLVCGPGGRCTESVEQNGPNRKSNGAPCNEASSKFPLKTGAPVRNFGNSGKSSANRAPENKNSETLYMYLDQNGRRRLHPRTVNLRREHGQCPKCGLTAHLPSGGKCTTKLPELDESRVVWLDDPYKDSKRRRVLERCSRWLPAICSTAQPSKSSASPTGAS